MTNPLHAKDESLLRNEAKALKDEADEFKNVAVAMTVTTGVFAGLAVLGIFIGRNDDDDTSPDVSAAPGGVRFRSRQRRNDVRTR